MGLLESLWHYTAKFAPRGNFGCKSDDSLARWIGWTLGPEILMDALLQSGWIDKSDGDRYLIHDWPEHADDAVHRQLARAQQWFADGTPPKLTRLGEKERQRAKAFYNTHSPPEDPSQNGLQPTPDVRPECAQRAPDVRTKGAQSAPRPAPPRQSPAPPRQSRKKEETNVRASARPCKQRVDTIWEKGIEAALCYSKNPERWELIEKWRGCLRSLAKDHPNDGDEVFARVIHGYRYARRGWAQVDNFFTLKTMLMSVANRELYLAAFHDAVQHGLQPPFKEPGDDSRVASARRVAQSIEDQISARQQKPPQAGPDDQGGTAATAGTPAATVRSLQVR
jgi:hypothetical protein